MLQIESNEVNTQNNEKINSDLNVSLTNKLIKRK